MIYWTNSQAPLRILPAGEVKLCDIPLHARVTGTGRIETDIVYDHKITSWVELIYETDAKTFQGWAYSEFLEPYVNRLPVDVVDICDQTPDKWDALQYFYYHGFRQVNMCGEICVCRIAGDNTISFLTKWENQSPALCKSIFGSGVARGTGAGELSDMLSVYGWDKNLPAPSALLTDPVVNREIITPHRLWEILKNNWIIVGCRLDTGTGKLNGGGVGHWVVIEKIVPNMVDDGYVIVYNPFMNRNEWYSWKEFRATTGTSLYGVCAPRKIT